jgi:hypothetical protein
MISIKEVEKFSSIKRRQINNRLKKISSKFPKLISGGGRGLKGKYKISPLFLKYLTLPNKIVDISSQNPITQDVLNDNFILDNSFDPVSTFTQIDWDWFGCINIPNSEIDDLLNSIPILKDGDLTYFSIHIQEGKKDHLHLHFCSKTDFSSKTLTTKYKGLMNTKIEKFELEKVEKCYSYLTDKTIPRRNNQRILLNGYIQNFKGQKIFIWDNNSSLIQNPIIK